MHASHELVAVAQGEFDPTPADFQVALAANPMRIDPATCAWGDPFGALCDQIEGRDGSYATQTLSSFHRTGGVSDLHLMGLNPQAKFVPIDEQTDDKIMHLN
jgi:hypothetical protein